MILRLLQKILNALQMWLLTFPPQRTIEVTTVFWSPRAKALHESVYRMEWQRIWCHFLVVLIHRVICPLTMVEKCRCYISLLELAEQCTSITLKYPNSQKWNSFFVELWWERKTYKESLRKYTSELRPYSLRKCLAGGELATDVPGTCDVRVILKRCTCDSVMILHE